jgi:serine/threonine protein kinase
MSIKSSLDKVIAHYRILNKIGAGGMGEVYLAEDIRLGRKVALKVLPEKFTKDEERIRRFTQEAKAASALNHPNIITIYDIGQTDSSHFIATEYVEGQTLRQHLNQARLGVKQTLDIAVQACSALAAAHQAGVVHRDIKPENIMLRGDGVVKLLDFGLAKLTETQAAVSAEAPTVKQVNTEPGVIMGTLKYLSPEQARGLKVDARTDVFSFGVVLYEMVTGISPFKGETASDVIASILMKEPEPLSFYSPEAPVELQRIISKALCKDREARYQTMQDMLVGLKTLNHNIEYEAKLERIASSDSSARGAIVVGSGKAAAPAFKQVPTSDPAATKSTSRAGNIVSRIKHHKKAVTIVLILLLLSSIGGYCELHP